MMSKDKTETKSPKNEKKAAPAPPKRNRKTTSGPSTGKARRLARGTSPQPREEPTKALFESANRLAKRLGVTVLFVNHQTLQGNESLLQIFENGPELILVVRGEEEASSYNGRVKKSIRVPDVALSRMDQVKLAVVIGLTERVLGVGDRLLCLVGRINRNTADTLVILDVGDEFETMNIHSQMAGTQEIDPKVFETTLTMALELANQGREGKPVGTIFVLGDVEEVLRYSRQMIINPFEGHPEASRSILDPNLRETVKEFSSLDGAFIVRKDGLLVAAGRHLNAAFNGEALPPGLGSRHAAAAAITGVTKALALTISESTGTVTIFREGKIMMALERIRQAASVTEVYD